MKIGNSHTITVDYTKSPKELVEKGGFKTDWPNIPSDDNFLVYGSKSVEQKIEIVTFDEKLNTPGVIEEMNKAGYRTVNLEELLHLVFISPYPAKDDGAIVALGYKEKEFGALNGPGVPYITYDFDKEKPVFGMMNGAVESWIPGAHFACVKK